MAPVFNKGVGIRWSGCSFPEGDMMLSSGGKKKNLAG
jgi:hypothetical protein